MAFYLLNEKLSSIAEITQDVASRGISLVYEQVEDETKDQLVSILVERLTTGKRCQPLSNVYAIQISVFKTKCYVYLLLEA